MAEGIFDRLARGARERGDTPAARKAREDARKKREEDARKKRQRGRDDQFHRENRGIENESALAQSLKKLFGRR